MSIKRQKTTLTVAFAALLLLSLLCFLFAFARYASAPAGIHNPEIHSKLTDDDRLFVYSVMRSQILQVSSVLGALAVLWAGFAAVALRLWRRTSDGSSPS
jgi:ABC-type transporter Mla subunit MlaD